jgi:hypothetical protein
MLYFHRYAEFETIVNGIQSVSEIRVLISTSERTHQFMKLFSITFCKIRKCIPRFFVKSVWNCLTFPHSFEC